MHIKINKDFETAYKDELYRGMSTREIVSLMVGAAAAGGVTFALHHWMGIPIELGIYAGVLCAAPSLALGFVTIQGLSPDKYLKEMIYAYKTRLLVYEADELPLEGRRIFTMRLEGKKRKRPWIRRRRKGGTPDADA